MRGSFAAGVLTLDLSIRDLSDTASVRFYVAADTFYPSPDVYDWAPDGDALFRYIVDVPLLLGIAHLLCVAAIAIGFRTELETISTAALIALQQARALRKLA